MKRFSLSILLIGLLTAAAFGENVKIKVRAALYDRDLNVKPIPRLMIKLVPAAPGAQPVSIQTSLEGTAEAEIPAGRYKVVTEKPVELLDKSYRWEFDTDLTRPENVVELSNDNAVITPLAGGRDARVDELAYQYKRVKDAVVTVWTEHGAYDGIVIDPAGLVLTVQSPLEQATWLAVQIDDRRRLPAIVVNSDKQHDLAVLRINPANAGEIASGKISADPGALIEGERIFTIENPNTEKNKKLVTGVVSKADAEEIVSDVKMDYIGSPLFNSSGNVVGIIQRADKGFRIRPIGSATGILAEAKQTLASGAPPSSQLLPTVPTDKYPSDNLRAPGRDHWEKDIYGFQAGEFNVELLTPIAMFEADTERYEQALKNYKKHHQGPPPVEPDRTYEPILVVSVIPKTKVPFMENMARGNNGPVIVRYKTAFQKMRLLCGDKEVTPIWPGRVVAGMGYGRNAVLVDESYRGRYMYAHDAITPQCGKVTIQIVSTKDPGQTIEKVFDEGVANRVWEDFEPYRKMQAQHTGVATQK